MALLVLIFGVAAVQLARRRTAARTSAHGATNTRSVATSPLSARLKRAAAFLCAAGLSSIVYGVSQHVPAYPSLVQVKATVTDISTIHRVEGDTDASPSSINPFASNFWVQLTVRPEGSVDDRVWKVNAALDKDVLRGLMDTRITGAVDGTDGRAEAFEVTKADGAKLVTYDDTTRQRHAAMILFLALGAVAEFGALILFLVSRSGRKV
jgi:hypothetical protein